MYRLYMILSVYDALKKHVLYIRTHVQFQSLNTGEGGSNIPRPLSSLLLLTVQYKAELRSQKPD